MEQAQSLINDILACTLCKDTLPLGPRPVLQFSPHARILIAGQAPGRKVHDSGIPFDDASGGRLRDWLGVNRQQFYDANQIAIVPMGFCYPGTADNGDLPPRPECARAWRAQLLAQLEQVQLTLVIGRYAMTYHLPGFSGRVTQAVQAWREYWPALVPMPHPSPRNQRWLRQNPWFESELLPCLQQRVSDILKD